MLQNVIAGGSVRRYVVCHFLDSALTVFVTNSVEVQGGFWWVWRFENGMQRLRAKRGKGCLELTRIFNSLRISAKQSGGSILKIDPPLGLSGA